MLVSIGSSILASADANGVADVSTRIAVTWWSIAGQLAYVVAAVLAIMIVRQVEERQKTKQSRLQSWNATAAAGSWAAS